MFDIQNKAKGLYTEISTLLSEYLVIQVQDCVKYIDSHEWKCSLIFFDYLLYRCGTSGFTEKADLLRLSK